MKTERLLANAGSWLKRCYVKVGEGSRQVRAVDGDDGRWELSISELLAEHAGELPGPDWRTAVRRTEVSFSFPVGKGQ
jgi:hypothetical protein